MDIKIDRYTGKVALSPSILTFDVSVEDNFNPIKIIEVQEGEKQKTNEQGQILYLNGEGIETTESRTVIKTTEKEVINKWTDEEGEEHSKTVMVDEPVEWIDNESVIVPNMIKKTITFQEDPTQFTALEVLNVKYNALLDNTPFDFIQAGIFLNEDKIDLTDIQANTGVAIMQLLPQGYAKSKELTLKDTVDTFRLLEFDCEGVDILVNDKKFVDNEIVLDKPTDKIILTFKNTTDKYIDVKSYAIAY